MADRRARDQVILDALARDIRRQDVSDVEALDLTSIAAAIDRALLSERREIEDGASDGLEPDELNSANDS